MTEQDYKDAVVKIYPTAFCEYTFSSDRRPGIQWYIEVEGKALTEDKATKKAAWKSAYETLKQQG